MVSERIARAAWMSELANRHEAAARAARRVSIVEYDLADGLRKRKLSLPEARAEFLRVWQTYLAAEAACRTMAQELQAHGEAPRRG